MSDTLIDEIADGIYRLSTFVADVGPTGFTFNQFLIDDDEPLLFHTGQRMLFDSVSAAVGTVVPIETLRWITFGHVEADECAPSPPATACSGNQEIARRTGLPKPTVTRLTYTLTQLGYLNYSPRLERYSLATGVLALGYATLANFGIRQVARPRPCRPWPTRWMPPWPWPPATACHMIYLEHCRGGGAVTLRLDIGSRWHILTSAVGRAFLVALPQHERDYLMDHIKRHAGDDWPEAAPGDRAGPAPVRQERLCEVHV